MTEERPKRSDQLPEEGPESVVPDDVGGGGDPRSAEGELVEEEGGEAAGERQPGRIGDPTPE